MDEPKDQVQPQASEANPQEPRPPFTKDPEVAPKPQAHDRIVVVESVHHIPAQGEAVTVESKFSRECLTKEQPYIRRNQVATQEWSLVDLGWIKTPGMVVLANDEGRHFQTAPTNEQREELSRKLLLVKLVRDVNQQTCGTWFLVPPGESMRGLPAIGCLLMVKSATDDGVRYTVTAFPG